MSENTFRPGSNFKEAVCIDAMRIFDSCSAQDCLEDLAFTFNAEDSSLIDDAAYIKTQSIDVTDVNFSISPVAFNQGFYSVDVTYNFRGQIEVFNGENTPPVVVYGNALFTKKVILYGSDGGTQRFVSDTGLVTTPESPTTGCACCKSLCTLPTASVSLVEPMCLDTKLTAPDPETGERTVLITIGLFAMISLSRPVPLMVPVYDYCVPGKECTSSSGTPCEMFEQIDFPVGEFFPRSLENNGCMNRCNNSPEQAES
ncbi:hypothetical protein [Ruminococcus sp.]|uniref:hypothetical protein n=1 Tax=Ruminococcus sp. TaxID=41978 RepID=UPI0025E9B1B4|nr:hypothetical protein [Ruminococcus sp.]MBQ8967887.1 hypothetical protein [Ruminococcus sp.]